MSKINIYDHRSVISEEKNVNMHNSFLMKNSTEVLFLFYKANESAMKSWH